jgi:Mn-dependent DtxR family transcriptional regulator
MACVNNQGELSESARRMLAVLENPATPADVAERMELPLFRVRSGLREMAEAGLVELQDGVYTSTQHGREMLTA